MRNLLQLEMLKIRRSKRSMVTAAVVMLYLGLMLIGFYTYAQNETEGNAEFRYTFENASYFNGLTFGLYAFYFGALMVLPIFAAAEGGAQIAGESHSGTIRLLLFRQITRSSIFLSKFALAFAYQTLLVGFLLLLALLLGLILIGWGDLNIYPGVLQMTDTHQHLTQTEALGAFLLAWVGAGIGMGVPLALSFLFATWLESPINVVASSTAVYLVLLVVSEIHFFEDLRPFLFSSYMGYWREFFREEIDWSALLGDGARLLSFGFAFLAIAHWRFRVREVP
jgi:ABC-2 type transport system permease protein